MPVSRPWPVDKVIEESTERTIRRVVSYSSQSSETYFVMLYTKWELSKADASSKMLYINSRRSAKRVELDLLAEAA